MKWNIAILFQANRGFRSLFGGHTKRIQSFPEFFWVTSILKNLLFILISFFAFYQSRGYIFRLYKFGGQLLILTFCIFLEVCYNSFHDLTIKPDFCTIFHPEFSIWSYSVHSLHWLIREINKSIIYISKIRVIGKVNIFEFITDIFCSIFV